jgi:transposase InsO family protein
VTLVGKRSGKEISARALLDSGAEGIIVDHAFAQKKGLTLRTLVNPIPVRNVDGTPNRQGTIKHTTIQVIRIKSLDDNFHEETAELYVTALGDHDIILGTDWLRAHNPEVDWAKPRLALTRCPDTCKLSKSPMVIEPRPQSYNSVTIGVLHPQEPDIPEEEPISEQLAINAFIQFHQYFKTTTLAIRAKITHSTEIAARSAPKPSIEHIPVEFRRYAKVFNEEASYRLPAHRPWDHAIDLIPNAPPWKRCGIYSLTPVEEAALKDWLQESLQKGYIRPSKSPMASSFFFVAKKDGKLRPVQNYIPLNDITVKNEAPLPLISDLLDTLRTARHFTKLDVRWGYNNVRIKEGDEWKAAFKTKFGLYEPLVMTFGLCNAPATFQTIMQEIFSDLIDEGHVIVYLDDILIFHESPSKLTELTHEVLRRFLKWDLYLKPEKCSFAKDTIEYLGFIVSNGHIKMDPEKVSGIMNWPQPANVKKVQSFLGFCNFYRRFIKDYSTIARPLFDLTKKDIPFVWGTAQQQAYDALLHAFTTAPLLALPDPTKPYRLITDASDFAIGAILEQPDALNRWHPVAYHSKSLQPAERNYEIHDKELLAIILALEHFRHYLEGHARPIEIWTDHGNLVYFTRKQKLSRRQARWALYLSRFTFVIIHKPGSQNKADGLSRRPDHSGGMELDNEQQILLDTKFFAVRATRPTAITIQGDTSLRDRIRSAQDYDTEVSKALESILKNGPRSISKGLEDWNLEDNIILYRGHTYVPKNHELRQEIVRSYHDHIATGHPGRWKTYELVSREFWWPGMSIFVRDFVDGCATCQATKVRPKTQVPLRPNQVPTNVWGIITMDFITDLPTSKGYDSLFVVVDRLSKAVIVAPCNKTITAEGTAQLYLDQVWRRTGLPQQVISDRGPQFASKVMQEIWSKLGVKSTMSTAFHPQTDGETERVNQELEQYLRVFCNFQVDNWAELIPFMEFAHNARTHSATGHSPFQVWYGYQPDFIPPLNFATTIPTVEDRLRSLDQIRNEVTAALKVAAETMKRSGPAVLSNVFKEGDLVWLEGTNIHTTHPKAKLAPRRHGPFKVLYSTATNTKLLLPKSWRIHPMFHNSLISPYKETTAHGPNYTRPPPDIVEGEDEHYEVETVLQSRLTPNRRGVQYLVKWKGYPDSENSWLPASGMKHATDLVQQFHAKNPRSPKPPSIHALQAQQDLKEGILLRTGPRNKKFQEHVTVRRSPDKSRDSGSLSGLRNQSPDRSHARSHAQSPARSPARSPALVHLSGPQRNKRTGPEHGTSPSSIEEAIQKIPLARGSRSTPTHRPDGSHERGNDSRG